MKNIKAVTVIIPVFNAAPFVERALKSYFSQTFALNTEYIIIDDGSTDDSLLIINKTIARFPQLKNSVRVIFHQKNKGMASVRNDGIENATGEYLIYLDADDYAEPNMIEEMYQKASSTDAEIVCCNLYLEFGRMHKELINNPGKTGREAVERLLEGTCRAYMHTKLIRRSLFVENSISNPEQINICDDMALSIPLFYTASKIEWINKSLYHYVQYNPSSMCRSFTVERAEEFIFCVSFLETFLSTKPEYEDIYSKALMYYKNYVKSLILLQVPDAVVGNYCLLYSEASPYSMRTKCIPLHNRITVWTMTHHLLKVGKVIRSSIQIVRKIDLQRRALYE